MRTRVIFKIMRACVEDLDRQLNEAAKGRRTKASLIHNTVSDIGVLGECLQILEERLGGKRQS